MTNAALLTLTIDRISGEAGYRQLYGQIRSLILAGRIKAGVRLPSTRQLASQLGLSRTTTISAYDQLKSEGYVETRQGAGYFVNQVPDHFLMAPGKKHRPKPGNNRDPHVHRPRPFQTSIPDHSLFPLKAWSHYLTRSWQQSGQVFFGTADSLGYGPLRQAIANHLLEWRGIAADPDQIIITAGSVEGFEITVKALVKKGKTVALEDPGYISFGRQLAELGRSPHYIPVDNRGANIRTLVEKKADAGLVVVTPSRQYPLGMTMPLDRRLELLDWSAKTGGYILEDDYDSEFRYQGRPIEPLATLDQAGRVIYAGTFSKIFSANLKLGYLYIPGDLLPHFTNNLQSRASMAVQPALAAFMQDGGFATHIRRCQRLYQTRQAALADIIEQNLPALTIRQLQPSGMHLIADLSVKTKSLMDDREAARRARSAGIMVNALSRFYRIFPPNEGLILGFSCYTEEEMVTAARKLQGVLSFNIM